MTTTTEPQTDRFGPFGGRYVPGLAVTDIAPAVTADGAVEGLRKHQGIVEPGADYEALHNEIKQITDQPVVLVINENGQGHAALGNTYWAEQGVPILAHEDAAAEFEERGHQILERMKVYNREKSEKTEITLP